MSVEFTDVEAAAQRINGLVHATPVMRSVLIDTELGFELHFKCEQLQKTGSFKARGACNAVALLADQTRAVATHSSGNHGAALAYAAKRRQLPASVVMPSNAPNCKKIAVAAYGASIYECEPNLTAREAGLAELLEQAGTAAVPPYDHPHIIAGQGTTALELLQQCEQPLDTLLLPVGGGGLLAGGAIAARHLNPSIEIIGCEPAGADDAKRSFDSGQRITQQSPNTMADGLRAVLGVHNFALIRSHVDDILTVSETAIVEAMAMVYSRMKQVIEPSAAVSLAVAMQYRQRFAGKSVGLVLSGGNIDLDKLPWS